MLSHLDHLKTYFKKNPKTSHVQFHEHRTNLLKNIVPSIVSEGELHFDVQKLAKVYAPALWKKDDSLTLMSIAAGNLGHLHRLQRSFKIINGTDKAITMQKKYAQYEYHAFIRLEDFDRDCISFIVKTDDVSSSIYEYLLPKLRLLGFQEAPLTQDTFYQPRSTNDQIAHGLINKPSVVYDYYRNTDMAYNTWFLQKGNGQLQPQPHVFDGRHCCYLISDLFLIFHNMNPNIDQSRTTVEALYKRLQLDPTLVCIMSRLTAEHHLWKDTKGSYITGKGFLNTMLHLLLDSSSFVKEIILARKNDRVTPPMTPPNMPPSWHTTAFRPAHHVQPRSWVQLQQMHHQQQQLICEDVTDVVDDATSATTGTATTTPIVQEPMDPVTPRMDREKPKQVDEESELSDLLVYEESLDHVSRVAKPDIIAETTSYDEIHMTGPPDITVQHVSSSDSMDAITADFINSIEERGIVAYYFKDTNANVRRIYELKQLTECVIGLPTSANDHKNKWHRKWNIGELSQNAIIKKFGEAWFIEVQSFIVWCLHVRFDTVLDYAKPIKKRLSELNPQITAYPSLNMGFMTDSVAILEGETYTDEEALGRIRQWDYADRFLEIRALRHNPPFLRRIFGANDNLYVAGELAKVAGPFARLEDGHKAVEPHFGEHRGPLQGLVSVRDPVSDRLRHFVTKDYFQKHLWNTLGDNSKPQYCKIALAYRSGAFNTDTRVKLGSAQVVQEAAENAHRLQTLATMEVQQQREEVLADLEEEIVPQLEGNAARDTRTVTNSLISEAVRNIVTDREFELEKYRIDVETKAKLDLDRHKEDCKHQLDLDRHKEDCKLQLEIVKAKEETNRKELDPATLNAQTSLIKAETAKCKAETGKIKAEKPKVVKKSTAAVLGSEIARRPNATGESSSKRRKDSVACEPAVIFPTFNPPRYSENYTRPRRGQQQHDAC